MKHVLVIGGTGFVGSALACRLAGAGFALTLPSRRPERVRHLSVLPTVRLVQADVHDEAALARLMAGHEAVINLAGILHGDFERVHVALPGKIGRAARKADIARLIHVSALGAAADAPSLYLKSKAAGEAALRQAYPAATIFRPSVIFGRGDSFLSLFARLARLLPIVPLVSPEARFQPVWVEDVVSALAAALAQPESCGATYALCGPRQYTLKELVAYAARVSGHPRPIVGLPFALSILQAWLMEFLPNPPLTRDNVWSMEVPNVCPQGSTLPFGLEATPLEAIAPSYLAGH
ncbi:MAG: complex I NDUFA9 subunit family protein [Rhodocyclaceae bacterium]|nr:complex I NDUFA9 subunit family protein [Rhodocyclaceae bacterium]